MALTHFRVRSLILYPYNGPMPLAPTRGKKLMHFFASRTGKLRWAAGAEAEGMFALTLGFDLAVLLFESLDVLAHGIQKLLEVHRGHDNARMNARAWHAGRHAREIENELGGGVRDDRKIGINSLRFFFT